MHVHFLDPYHPANSLVHRADPRVKLALTLMFILTCALLPSGVWGLYILLLAFVQAAAILSELGPKYLLKRAFLALPFALAALPLIFSFPGNNLVTFDIGDLVVRISDAGLIRFASIALKSWISVQAAILLTATTPFPDLLVALRALKLPRILITTIGLMWRYLFVLVDEALRLMRARDARSSDSLLGTRTGGDLMWRGKVTGGMAGSLFLRAFDRSDRIFMAMMSRGYDGEVRTLPQPSIPTDQKIFLIGGLLTLILLNLFGWLLAS